MAFLRLAGVQRSFSDGQARVEALRGLDLCLEAGHLVAVLGPSGSGKTTLLNLLGGLDRPDQGEVEVQGQALHELDEEGLRRYRRQTVGIVFQFFNLVDNLTALENLELVRELTLARRDPRELLEQVGLAGREHSFPHQLSGGEQQRVAIARALLKEPKLLLADEPTGNLDSRNARQVMDLFCRYHRQGGSVVMTTHNPQLAECATCTVVLKDGQVVECRPNPAPRDPSQGDW